MDPHRREHPWPPRPRSRHEGDREEGPRQEGPAKAAPKKAPVKKAAATKAPAKKAAVKKAALKKAPVKKAPAKKAPVDGSAKTSATPKALARLEVQIPVERQKAAQAAGNFELDDMPGDLATPAAAIRIGKNVRGRQAAEARAHPRRDHEAQARTGHRELRQVRGEVGDGLQPPPRGQGQRS
jgi:hypothetical protein